MCSHENCDMHCDMASDYCSSISYIDPPDPSSHLGESTYCWSGSSSTDWSFRWTNSASASVMQLAVGSWGQAQADGMLFHVCMCVWALIATDSGREVWVCREMCVWAPCSAEGCMTIDLWRPKRLDCHRGVPLAAVRLSFSLSLCSRALSLFSTHSSAGATLSLLQYPFNVAFHYPIYGNREDEPPPPNPSFSTSPPL